MRKLKSWQVGALGALVVAAAALGVSKGKQIAHAVVGPADRHLRFQLEWQRGEKLTYAFTWRGKSETSFAALGATSPPRDGKMMEGSVDLDGDLVVESYGARDGAFLLREHVEHLRRHEVRALDHDVIPTDDDAKAAFDGKSVLVAVDAAGTVRGMYFAKGEAPIFQHVMQSLVTETSVTVAPNGVEAWDAVETTGTGTAQVHYEVEEMGPPHVRRDRVAYTQLASALGRTASKADGQLSAVSMLVLDPDEHLVRSLSDDEDVSVKNAADPGARDFASRTHFEMTLREVSRFDARDDAPDLAQLDTRRPGQLAVGARADEQIQEQRIAGLTGEELRNTVVAYSVNGGIPSSSFISRATGYLAAHPEACLDMVALFETPGTSTRGRTMMLELLASAGTPQAQEAMRVALESPAAHEDKRAWEALVQRFSLVSHPTNDSVQFVAASYHDARDATDRAASAYALGASAGNMAKNGGDPAVVKSAESALVSGLRDAKTPTERKNMLGALGNLGLTDTEATVASYAKDESPDVRAAAAWALHRIDDEDARTALFGFATDASPSVATNAYQALAEQSMTSDDWRAFASVVGRTPPQADNALLSLLSQNVAAGQPVAQMLQAMLAREVDNTMLARIRHVLQQIQQ